MPTYHDLLVELGQWGPYLGDVIGKCQREVTAFTGSGRSRIDKYLLESDTYAAALKRCDLKSEFNAKRAEPGFLIWKEGRKNGIQAHFPIAVDMSAGIVKSLVRDEYGLLSDVRECLHRKTATNTFVRWESTNDQAQTLWAAPTQQEIDMHDSSKSSFGTAVTKGRRVGQIGWRARVEKLWNFECAITGCKNAALLDGAHILPHRDGTTEQRLDEQNGILLATHLHRAFDRGLISFTASGKILFSPHFHPADREALGLNLSAKLKYIPQRTGEYLAVHRKHYGFISS